MQQTVHITRDDITRLFVEERRAVEQRRRERVGNGSRKVIAWAYRARPFQFTFSAGAEHESDPDVFTVWLYLGFFGVAVSWCRDGWLYPNESTQERAIAILNAAPDPNIQTAAFCDAWDQIDNEENAIDARSWRNRP